MDLWEQRGGSEGKKWKDLKEPRREEDLREQGGRRIWENGEEDLRGNQGGFKGTDMRIRGNRKEDLREQRGEFEHFGEGAKWRCEDRYGEVSLWMDTNVKGRI